MIFKTTLRFCRILVSGSLISGCLIATAFAQQDDIVGTWDCGLTIEDQASGAVINADFETSYNANGTYTRVGVMSIVVAAFEVDISIGMDEAGNWRLVDSTGLAETATEVDLSSTAATPSPMETVMLQQMQQEATAALSQEEVAQIRSLTATTMQLEDDDGAALSCAKA